MGELARGVIGQAIKFRFVLRPIGSAEVCPLHDDDLVYGPHDLADRTQNQIIQYEWTQVRPLLYNLL